MSRTKITWYANTLASKAKDLRRNMTKQEKHLWYDFLRTYQPKFYRQRRIDHYIVDFYCSACRLVVELDGSQHYEEEGIRYDAMRTKAFNAKGIEILRFSNLDVNSNFEGVCTMIDLKVKEKLS